MKSYIQSISGDVPFLSQVLEAYLRVESEVSTKLNRMSKDSQPIPTQKSCSIRESIEKNVLHKVIDGEQRIVID